MATKAELQEELDAANERIAELEEEVREVEKAREDDLERLESKLDAIKDWADNILHDASY